MQQREGGEGSGGQGENVEMERTAEQGQEKDAGAEVGEVGTETGAETVIET
jgi:hypothetical protein